MYKYTLKLGLISLPKTSSYEHIKENPELDFGISDEDMKILYDLDAKNYGKYSCVYFLDKLLTLFFGNVCRHRIDAPQPLF